ncbi:MAG: DUF1015 domain-containing protein [Actinomycetota bacterium]|nr:DUF1015 domain-containing protein [Actinomycetota bacterium]
MPRFEPFRGLRYDPDRVPLARVVAPPYDVISPDERMALQAQSPYNSVRIELPDEDPGLDRYEAAARRIADWRAEGILRQDITERLYGYRMTYLDEAGHRRRTIGVIGALGLEPPGTAGIFPHERTTPKAKSDRLQLLQATRVNTSPIWGLSLARGLSEALESPVRFDRVTDAEGIEHELWPIIDPAAIAWISQAVSDAPVVIADGHHRFETALNYQGQRRAAGADSPGSQDSVMALVVELAEDQLSVQAIHRLIGGLPADFDLVGALGGYFELTPTEAPDATILERMAGNDSLALVTPGGTWLLHPRPETTAAARQDLDSSRLEVALAALPEHELVYQHHWDLASGAVDRGEAQAAVLLRPVTVEQIASTGRGGERMPPKSTFFWPKPRTGFVFREVAG